VARGGVSPSFAAAELSARNDGATVLEDVDTGELFVEDESWSPDTLAAFRARQIEASESEPEENT
jgi:hypothetical protein